MSDVVSDAELDVWLEECLARNPSSLQKRARVFLDGASGSGVDRLVTASLIALDESLVDISKRDTAYDLLAGAGLITYAFMAAGDPRFGGNGERVRAIIDRVGAHGSVGRRADRILGPSND